MRVPPRLLSAALVAGLGAVLVRAQGALFSLYVCSPAEFGTCDTELKTCLTFASQFQRSAAVRQSCFGCYSSAYMCYRDCTRFADGFGRACNEVCGSTTPATDYSAACAPPQYTGPSGALSTGLHAAAAAAPFVAAALLRS
jgi:hypothetical protein